MKIGIMQPYFIPYVGYFQLINLVDQFVIYDNIQYTKKGWIKRNRILLNNKVKTISLPLKKDSDFLDIKERQLASNWGIEKKKILNTIKSAYRKSPYFEEGCRLVNSILDVSNNNLFDYLFETIKIINNYLQISTPIVKSSDIKIDHCLRSSFKIIEICKKTNSKTYINSIGGLNLYDKKEFKKQKIELKFIKTLNFKYNQISNDFHENLSIIDIIMNCSNEEIKNILLSYKLE